MASTTLSSPSLVSTARRLLRDSHLPLDSSRIADGEDVGAGVSFSRLVDGQLLSFSSVEGKIVDDQTGSEWNILGKAISGPLTGESLTPIVHADHFWFSWAAFKPDTTVYSE